MIKIATLILFLSITLCSARDPGHWKAWNNADLLNRYMVGFKFGGDKQLVSDSYLNTLAQAVAEIYGNPNDFIRKYPGNGENVLVYGITLRAYASR